MKPLSIRQIRQVVGGKALSPIPADAPTVVAVCTDTRRMEGGSLFIALRGDNFNGNDFLPDAARGGAVAALVDTIPEQSLPNVLMIQVPDTRIAMRKLANYCRTQMRAKVVGVAGSNGKTSTKHLIDAALSGKLRGSISPKNWNNEIGVPLTIFPADPLQDYIVLEMGTNHHGEIRILSDMATPDIAVITNCGADHLEFLGDTMGVRRENATILSGLKPGGLLVVNGDDPELLSAVNEWKGQRVTFGLNPSNDLFATEIRVEEAGTKFTLNNSRREVFIPFLGAHSACNALAAIAVARKLAVPEDVIIASLASAHGPEMRLQWQVIGDVRVLNDAYNANPNSMKAALDTVAALPCNGRRIAVLGDMRELGPSSERYHREIGQQVAAAKAFDGLICVGQDATFIADAAQAAGFTHDSIWRFPDSGTASLEVPSLIRGGDLVLLKASRGVRLEAVANALEGKGAEQQIKLVAS
jgi:UDP-N-acetylmuramoyl-tripeptide--D-alanyl-D-alanine ligase